jgi:hypothetical protein
MPSGAHAAGGVTDTLWVTGGEQRGVPHWTREWRLYRRALVVKVENGRATRVLEYETPPEHCPDETPSIVFKAGSVAGNRAFLCTQTEILVCDFPSFTIRRVISHPFFNDVHHVAPAPDGRLFVAVTGLDAVAELTPEGELLRLQSVLGGSVWDRFSPEVDYRKIPTTKPHQAHPNYIFFLDGEPWVTRFEQRDAVPLDGNTNGKRRLSLGGEPVHDGVASGKHVYFTAVNGILMRFDLEADTKADFDLNRFSRPDRALGWCRGILPDADGTVWVGFSRVRYTALRQNVDWIRRGFHDVDRAAPAPTRIARYDLVEGALKDEIELENAGMNTVFSIHRPSASSATGKAQELSSLSYDGRG